MLRRITEARNGMVWSAHGNSYEIERWNPVTGALDLTLRRTVPWFPYADTIIEVLDRDGSLLLSQRVDRYIGAFVGDDEVAVPVGNPTEDFGVTLFRVTLVSPLRSGGDEPEGGDELAGVRETAPGSGCQGLSGSVTAVSSDSTR